MKRQMKHDLISLKSYPRKSNSHKKFGQDIRKAAENIIFTCKDMNEIYFEMFKLIEETQGVINEQKAIDQAFEILFKHLQIRKDTESSIQEVGTDKDEPIRRTVTKGMDYFNTWILQIGSPPYYEVERLKVKTKKDLKEVNGLIQFYESLPEVKEFWERPENNKRTAKSNKIIHFYKKCLDRRNRIVDYYLEGVYQRALVNCQPRIATYLVSDFFKEKNDYPYDDWTWWVPNNYDFRKINCSFHRLRTVWTDEISDYQQLYIEDKERFYRKLFKHRKNEEIEFKDTLKYLEFLPTNKGRLEIFIELEKLFRQKKWMAFFALALPQVEGLFAEMIQAFGKKDNTSSLTEKVRLIRLKQHDNLDYYEFVLPEIRNRFAHGGLIENIKLLAYDLATDLEHLVELYSELKNPYIELCKILKSKHPNNLNSYEEVGTYFMIVDEISAQQKKEVDQEVKEFSRKLVVNNENIKFLVKDAVTKMEDAIKQEIQRATEYFEECNLRQTKPEITKPKRFDDIEEAKKMFLHFGEENFSKILNAEAFFKGIKAVLGKKQYDIKYKDEQKVIEKNRLVIHNLKEIAGLHAKKRGERAFSQTEAELGCGREKS